MSTPDGYVTDEAQLLHEIRTLLASVDAKTAGIFRTLAYGKPDPVWPAARFVLVKGYHDSGTITGVYGPYDEAHCDWLLTSVLDCSSYNWTKVKLSTGPEEG